MKQTMPGNPKKKEGNRYACTVPGDAKPFTFSKKNC